VAVYGELNATMGTLISGVIGRALYPGQALRSEVNQCET